MKKFSRHNLRIGYGFDITLITGWSLVVNFERFQSNGKGYSNYIYLSVKYVPVDKINLSLIWIVLRKLTYH